jgi:hypothetical protein
MARWQVVLVWVATAVATAVIAYGIVVVAGARS